MKQKNKSGFADLHLHTFFSDGTSSPEELVKGALLKGISTISVCDHDTIDGINSARAEGENLGVEVLSGIELSVECGTQEVHILGYLIDYQNLALIKKLEELKNIRIERVHKMIAKLNKLGVSICSQDVFDFVGSGTVGRLHIARALVKVKAVASVYDAFQKYVGDNCSAYVLGFRFSPAEAIALIKQAGGIPVLAHPYILRNDELIKEFVDSGLMGLEVYYPEHSQSMINFYLDLAKQYNLLVTGGSDFHGLAKPGVEIGAARIPYELIEKLKAAVGEV